MNGSTAGSDAAMSLHAAGKAKSNAFFVVETIEKPTDSVKIIVGKSF